jgi:hypothetical protein
MPQTTLQSSPVSHFKMRAVLVIFSAFVATVSAIPIAADISFEKAMSKFKDANWKHITPASKQWKAQPGKLEPVS